MVQTEYIAWDDQQIQVVRTQRQKTVSVQIEQGQVRIMVPQALPMAQIQAILAKKTHWIRDKLHQQQHTKLLCAKEFIPGETFYLLGQHLRLQLVEEESSGVYQSAGRLVVSLPVEQATPEQVRDAIIVWYRRQAEVDLPERVRRYEQKMQVRATSVVVKPYKARWGTCYADGRVTLNWKIIMAPSRVVDYVVVHELSHLVHMNHSRQFWQLVQQYHPGYQAAKAWLKEHGMSLHI
jgi:predicted metal-dependent hydrolase